MEQQQVTRQFSLTKFKIVDDFFFFSLFKFRCLLLDLTIRCLSQKTHDDTDAGVVGLVIAFCCHHRCDYGSYVGKKFLASCSFSLEEFSILCSIASWATCGFEKNQVSMDCPIGETT